MKYKLYTYLTIFYLIVLKYWYLFVVNVLENVLYLAPQSYNERLFVVFCKNCHKFEGTKNQIEFFQKHLDLLKKVK